MEQVQTQGSGVGLNAAIRRMANRSIKAFDIVRQSYPMVLPIPVDRYARLRKIRIRKGADGNGHDIGQGVRPIKNGGAALGTEVKAGFAAFIADKHVLRAPPGNGHGVSRKPGLNGKHAAGPFLARQAMADRDTNGFSLGGDDELSTAT
jgi:hypothetical protein